MFVWRLSDGAVLSIWASPVGSWACSAASPSLTLECGPLSTGTGETFLCLQEAPGRNCLVGWAFTSPGLALSRLTDLACWGALGAVRWGVDKAFHSLVDTVP